MPLTGSSAADGQGVMDEAYRKHQGHGGGTAAISRHPAGIRRAHQTSSLLRGRATFTATHVGKAVTFASFYGMSGAPLVNQLPLWKELADTLMRIGKPFIVAGDWQRPPHELRESGLCKLLGAEVCAPNCATNLQSGNNIDFSGVHRTTARRMGHPPPLWMHF